MSDDLNKKLKQITDILGQDTLPDNLKGLLSLLTSSMPGQESSPRNSEASDAKEEKAEKSDLEENIEMVRKIKRVMDRLNTTHDPRINLLTAIKPFLSNRRQKKLNNCLRLIQMSNLTRYIDEHDNKGGS